MLMELTETRYEIDKGVATITLYRPARMNAFTPTIRKELIELFAEADKDDAVRVVVVTGAGSVFCAGADLSAGGSTFDRSKTTAIGEHRDGGGQVTLAIFKCRKPVIAAINGYAMGGGLELALACDIRVASENARMGLPEVSLGIIPGTGGPVRLPRLVPKGIAMQMLLTGEPIDAQEAYRIGLVNKVVPEGQAVAAAEEIANKIIKNGPLAVMLVKDVVEVGQDLPLDAAVEYDHKNVLLSSTSEDAKEGLTAFLEKRPPQWKGK